MAIQMFLSFTLCVPGALMGASLTCGSEAIPVLLRHCSIIALRAGCIGLCHAD